MAARRNDRNHDPEESVDPPVMFPGNTRAVAPLGVGTWAWGDRTIWGMGGYDHALTEPAIRGAWESAIDAGVVLFDTAEVYGGGESERIIGRLIAEREGGAGDLFIATKFLPHPLKFDVRRAMRDALCRSLERLGLESVDLYQLHGPVSLRSHAALAEALAAVRDEGLVSAVGVSNYSTREMISIHGQLARRGVELASNQIEFSPLRRSPETGGLLQACTRLGVVPLAYSPLGQGRLTGKYSASNPPPGKRYFSAFPMEQVDPLVEVLRRIGMRHADGDGGGERTPSQVVLRWIIQKGAVPIPGAKNATQAKQNSGALGWSLSEEEMAEIDSMALEGRFSLKNRIWQHG